MPKRKPGVTEVVSLFPFLSILACVIGTLTLMITALALGQMEKQQAPEAVERAEQHQEHQADIKSKQKAVESVDKKLADAAAIRDEMARAMEELKKLERQQLNEMKKADNDRRQDVQLLAEANRLRKRITELTPEPPRLQTKIKLLLEEIGKRTSSMNEAVNKIRPGGSGLNLDPTFVECTAGGVVLSTGNNSERVRRADLSKSKPFLALLDRVSKNPKGTVIFLIRDDAIATYHTARSLARARYCRNGKLPVVGHGRIDLSVFENIQ